MKWLFHRLFWLVLLGLGLWAVRESVVFVDETEWVVATNFGRIVAVYDQPGGRSGDKAGDRGLHFKLPWQGVRRFDRRLQVFAPPAREMVTNSRNVGSVSVVGGNLTVACYVCWRIPPAESPDTPFDERPVVRFLRSVGTLPGAEGRLDKLVRSKLGSEIANVQLSDLVRIAEEGRPPPETIAEIGLRVRDALHGLRDEAGFEVVDVRISRLNLPEGNRRAVYARQMSERRRIAEKYRSEGKAEAQKILSKAARERDEILSRAYAEAQQVKGAGEAAAARTYAEAYARDPEFYRWLRALQAYETMLGDQTTLVLSADSPLFRLLREGPPVMEPARGEPPAVQLGPVNAVKEGGP